MINLTYLLLTSAMAVPSGQLAYAADDGSGGARVHVVDLANGEAVAVGPGPADGAPVWAPDGAWLAFEAALEDGEGRGVYVVQADGSGGRFLDHQAAPWNTEPQWSPGGDRIAYSGGAGLARRVFVYDLAEDAETVWGGGREGLLSPVWLDDETIAAAGLAGTPGRDLSADIFAVTETGADQVPLEGGGRRYFEWSLAVNPQQRETLAFESNDGGYRDIFVASRDGAFINVSNHRAADWRPQWAPDGQWIAFESFRSGRVGVHRAHIESLRVHDVAVDAASDNWGPAWSPDGRWIAYVSGNGAANRLRIAEVRGDAVHDAPGAGAPVSAPTWRPVP